METIVVYEFDRSATASGRGSDAAGLRVHRVHVAPGAPGNASSPGPRTFCGKDTFAMEKAPWRPAERQGSSWYPPEYADRICESCVAVMEDEG
ncbi:hypothetical protein [Streptomyces caatingaensis]|uniref:Uncharacterized protein n=1 Tax=Streptomyces caatingaensis TaxID=1678637 RepID=A0A0K9XJE4_9ACTN|nr:hypothetical protein [Streptomyces caatingaensis]KNB53171.1 hypothetical protein AC230_06845 [Streptomyces caatingaensis]